MYKKPESDSGVFYSGSVAQKITKENFDLFEHKPHFGNVEVGRYAVYLGPYDGGFLILDPTDRGLSGVPKDEVEFWGAQKECAENDSRGDVYEIL